MAGIVFKDESLGLKQGFDPRDLPGTAVEPKGSGERGVLVFGECGKWF
jgi:hypothetical protein